MKTISRQVLCLMLALCLCITALPMPALATEGQTPEDAAQSTPQQTETEGVDTETLPAEDPVDPGADPPQQEPDTTDPEPTPAPSDKTEDVEEEPAAPTPEPSDLPEGEDAVEPTPAPEQPETANPTPTPEETESTPTPEPAPTPAAESSPVPSDGLVEEQAADVPILGLDFEPISYAVVYEPLVKVTYHYTDVQVATPTNLPTSSISAHSYFPLTELKGGRMTIPANLFPGEVSVSTDALRVTLDGELDITAQAEYDAENGTLYLPARYWGHKVDVDWHCPYTDVTDITISVRVGVKTGGVFEEEYHTLTLPSNADIIEIPLPEGGNAVVTQYGIDLPASAHSIKNGVMYLTASPLGGDITVTAYVEAPRMRLFATRSTRPTQVAHTRSSDQIWYGYYTSYYEANGNTAFCLDPTVSGLNSGTYEIDYWITDRNDLLLKCCYYLYGGPSYISVKHVFAEPDALWAYGMCHAMASYAYMGSLDAFEGLDDELTGQLMTIANAINGLPPVPEGFEAFVYNSGSSTQPLIGWQYNPGSDPWEPDPWEPEPEPEPDPTGSVAVRKVSADTTLTDGNPCYSLAGAVFDVYAGSSRVGSITTNSSGYGSLSGLPVGSGYTIVERTPPSGFAGTTREYSFSIYEDDTTTVTVENVPQNDPTTIMVRKQDADTNSAAPQGGAGLAGAQFTIKYYKGSYSNASALSGVTPARTWVVETDEDGFAMLHPDYKVSGDAFYYNSTGDVVTLPLGTVTIEETKAPAGYLLNSEVFIRQITPAGNMESVETFNEPVVKESVIRGGVSVEKWDAALNRKEAQGDASLQGAVFEIINKNDNSVVVNGQTYAPNAVVFTLTTDASGTAATVNNLLPYGNWELSEKSSPSGYLNTGTIRRSFKITQNGAMVSLNTADSAIKNDVIKGGVLIQKWDAQLNRAEAQGDATLEGATFTIYNRSQGVVVVGGKEYKPGDAVITIETDETGTASTAADALPFGSYEAVEESDGAPQGYLNTGVVRRTFTIREDGKIISLNTADSAIKNNVVRGGLLIQKWDNELNRAGDAQGDATLQGATFDVLNQSAGPVVVGGKEYAPDAVVLTLTTDATGTASTAADALPFGSYRVVERQDGAPEGYLGTGVLEQSFEIRENGKMVSLNISESVIKNDVARGGVLIQKWDTELDRSGDPQGDGTLENAVFRIVNRSAGSVMVDGQEYAPGETVLTLRTDETGTAATAERALPYGSYEIFENPEGAPEGYLSSGVLRQTFQIRQDGQTVEMNTADAVIKNDIKRGGFKIEKWDIERGEAGLTQGDATLEGAILDVYNISAHSVIVDGVEYAPGEVVLTLETDAAGAASVAADALPYGSYQVLEREGGAPEGYLNSGIIQQAFQVREDGVIVDMTTDDKVIQNEIIRGNVTVQKRDNETGENQAQGGGTLAGAVFELVNRSRDSVLVQDVLYAPGEVVYTMETDETGTATTPEYLLPYATFEVREVSPPLEGYLSTGVLSRFFEIREHGKTVMLDTAETAIRNDPLRGDLAGVKIADSSLKRLAGVPFRITSLTTGEAHVVITDKNGEFSTASSWNLHSKNTNRGETAEDGVWFGDIDTLDDGKGALLYDDYLLEELPREANEGYELVSFEVSVYRHNTLLHLGTLTDDVIPVPEISTTALEKESMGNNAYAAERVTIVDTIYYSGLKPGAEYTLKGVLMDKATGEPLMVNENQVTAEKTFRATGESGSATMEFTFDASALKGKAVVVFENLYLEDKEIAVHADISDEGQTIHFSAPEIGTTATGEQGEKVLDATAETVIVDTVSYIGLIPGQQYTVKGTLMDKTTAAPIQSDGKPVVAETSFIPDAADGTIEVIFTFDAVAMRNTSVVVFERLYHNGREIAVHTDINDAAQTVSFQEIKIGTKATGRNGEKTLPVSSAMTIVDTVSYDGLAIGQEYTLQGTLMSKTEGKPIQVDGKPVTAETRFKPEKESGTVEVVFTFDGSALSGQQLVVFESLLLGETEIAAHKDIGDAGQTVSVGAPKIGTSAKGKNGEKELSVSQSVTIVDTVTYEGLAPGTEYTIKGVLMDQESGKPIQNGGKDITARVTLKPDKSSGSVDVLFTFDASGLAGKKVVVFETLYLGDTEIASHRDLKDEGQTVSFHQPEIGTSAAGKDGGKVLVISKAATIVDTVTYKGLSVGQKYTLRGTLMDKETGKALLVDGKEVTAEASFTPDKPDGKVEVTFTFDASGLKDRQVVVFEKLLLGESVIAVHEDIEDKAQTVAFVSHALRITKIDKSNNKKLDGAEFTLYGADGKAIKLSRDKDGVYYPDDSGSAIISTVEGVAVVKDLLSQQYTLREVTVPEGYEGYDEPLTFVMELRDTEDDPFPIVIYNAPEGYKEGSGAKTGRSGLPVWALITGIGLLAAGAAVGVVYFRRRKAD